MNEDVILLLIGFLGILILLGALGVGLDLAEKLGRRQNRTPWEPVRRKEVVGRPRDDLDQVMDIVNRRRSA